MIAIAMYLASLYTTLTDSPMSHTHLLFCTSKLCIRLLVQTL
jgi:hypothetical protein